MRGKYRTPSLPCDLVHGRIGLMAANFQFMVLGALTSFATFLGLTGVSQSPCRAVDLPWSRLLPPHPGQTGRPAGDHNDCAMIILMTRAI